MAKETASKNYIGEAIVTRAGRIRKLRARIAKLEDESQVTKDNIKLCKSELDLELAVMGDYSQRMEAGEQMLLPEEFEHSPQFEL